MSSPFEGQLVRLRAREPGDAETVRRWMTDEDVLLYNTARYPRSMQTLIQRSTAAGDVSYYNARFAIVRKADGELIGDVFLQCEEPENRCAWLSMLIGLPEHRSQGYGTDALRTVVRFAFEQMNLQRVELEVFAENHRARTAYRKAGFVEEGVRRRAIFTHGRYHDQVMMALLRDEWEAAQQ